MLRILQAAAYRSASGRSSGPVPRGGDPGSGGPERYSACTMLRSLVVLPSWRRQGLGRRPVTAQLSRLAPGTPLYLLTSGARRYFASLWFQAIPREDVPPAIKESVEFRGTSPQSATVTCLALNLPPVPQDWASRQGKQTETSDFGATEMAPVRVPGRIAWVAALAG